MTGMPTKKNLWGGLLCSSFLSACLAFAAVDSWVGTGTPLQKIPTAGLHRTEVARAAQEFAKLKEAPSVVLLGSSLMVAPVIQADANVLHAPLERNRHRRSYVLESAIAPGNAQKVFNFAVAGCMVSDAYFIARSIVQKKPPQTIIYGIAPRDFVDNIVPGIDATEVFRYLARPEDLICSADIADDSLFRRVDLMASRLSAIYRVRADLVPYANLRFKKLMEKTLPWVAFGKLTPCGVWMEIKGYKFPEEYLTEQIAYPDKEVAHISVSDTTQEYRCRYNPIREKRVREQMQFLDKLAMLCAWNHIRLVVVNMPLSNINRTILPQGFEQKFASDVQATCGKHDVQFVDWSHSDIAHEDSSFIDGVHLTSNKSIGFVRKLAELVPRSALASGVQSVH